MRRLKKILSHGFSVIFVKDACAQACLETCIELGACLGVCGRVWHARRMVPSIAWDNRELHGVENLIAEKTCQKIVLGSSFFTI